MEETTSERLKRERVESNKNTPEKVLRDIHSGYCYHCKKYHFWPINGDRGKTVYWHEYLGSSFGSGIAGTFIRKLSNGTHLILVAETNRETLVGDNMILLEQNPEHRKMREWLGEEGV